MKPGKKKNQQRARRNSAYQATLIGQLAEVASEVPERLGCCHGPTQARGRYVH